MESNAKQVVVSYLKALNDQDFKAARSYLHDYMSFIAPVGSYNSADAYLKGNELLRSKYGIEKVLYDIKKVFVDGDDVCAFFDFNIGSATLFACGWFQGSDGKIGSIRVVFDPGLLLNRQRHPARAKYTVFAVLVCIKI